MKIAKVGLKFCQQSKKYNRLLKFCPSGERSPNLFTLGKEQTHKFLRVRYQGMDFKLSVLSCRTLRPNISWVHLERPISFELFIEQLSGKSFRKRSSRVRTPSTRTLEVGQTNLWCYVISHTDISTKWHFSQYCYKMTLPHTDNSPLWYFPNYRLGWIRLI